MRSWRAEWDRLLLLFFGVPSVGAFLWGVHTRQWAGFAAGVVAGMFALAWALLRDEGPSYLEHWRAGAEGERKTTKVLRSLGWHVVDDVDNGKGNYDHIVVGPPGVFLIETKNRTGEVHMRNGEPWLVHRHDPDGAQALRDVSRKALGASAALHEEIERRSGLNAWVSATVVFWCDFQAGIAEGEKIAYVHGNELAEWLRARPSKLSPGEIACIAGVLAGLKAEGDVRARHSSAKRSDASGRV